MRIGVNTVWVPANSGVEDVYLRNVLAKMREVQPDNTFVLFTDSDNHDSFDGWERICLDRVGPRPQESVALPHRLLDRAASDARVDLVFSSINTAPSRLSVRTVLYAMDLLFLTGTPEEGRGLSHGRIKELKKTAIHTRAIVVPSEFVRKELLAHLSFPLDRAVVAHLGVSSDFEEPGPCMTEPPYILSVGSTRHIRNLDRLVDASQRLQSEMPHALLVVGRAAEAEPPEWGPNIMRIHHCPLNHLAAFFQHSAAAVFPALYDGTGVGVLEALRAGARVAAARVGAIPEVAGRLPIYFNPESVASMMGAIRRAAGEQGRERADKQRMARQHAAQYTWEQCAWRTLLAFKRR